MLESSLSYPSPAKINLALRVGEKFPNGNHQLVTTLAPIALFDLVTLRLIDGSLSHCSAELAPSLIDTLTSDSQLSLKTALSDVQRNLAGRAAKAVLGNQSFELFIEKNIPTEAGLGGGSGNAAITLILANKLLGNKYSLAELIEIGRNIGSDVAPMLFQAPILQSGINLTPIELPEEVRGNTLLLIKPPFGTSTRAAYEGLNRSLATTSQDFTPSLAIGNDFEEIFSKEGWFREGKSLLLELGAHRVLLSGSGSTIIGFFEPSKNSAKTSEPVTETAKKRLKNWWVYQTQFWS